LLKGVEVQSHIHEPWLPLVQGLPQRQHFLGVLSSSSFKVAGLRLGKIFMSIFLIIFVNMASP